MYIKNREWLCVVKGVHSGKFFTITVKRNIDIKKALSRYQKCD